MTHGPRLTGYMGVCQGQGGAKHADKGSQRVKASCKTLEAPQVAGAEGELVASLKAGEPHSAASKPQKLPLYMGSTTVWLPIPKSHLQMRLSI
jgi:hypothetical protein